MAQNECLDFCEDTKFEFLVPSLLNPILTFSATFIIHMAFSYFKNHVYIFIVFLCSLLMRSDYECFLFFQRLLTCGRLFVWGLGYSV